MKDVINSSYESVGINKIKPHPMNPRRGNLEAIKTSIKANGFYGAVVVQRSTGYILAGNHRWQGAKAEGLKNVPVIYVDVDDMTAKKILMADNRTSDLGEYDNEQLAELLGELSTHDELVGTGYDQTDLDVLLKTIEADFQPVEELTDLGQVNPPARCRCPNCGADFDLKDAKK